MGKDAEVKSRYPAYEKPVFQSKIPPHLVSQLEEKEQWLMNSISRLEQKADWLVEKQLETNSNVRDTDERLQLVELWKTVLSGKWAVTGALGLIAVTAALGALVKLAIEKVF
jgi:hypothetical protein